LIILLFNLIKAVIAKRRVRPYPNAIKLSFFCRVGRASLHPPNIWNL